MKTFSIFITVVVFICIYILYYHKIETTNFLDVIHTGFVRQFVFELIPFIIMFGVRDMKFLDISNTGNFFNSLIGRSILGMIGFTFVSYAITTISPKKTPPLIPFLTNNNNNNFSQTGGEKNLNNDPFIQSGGEKNNNELFLSNIDHNLINGNEKLISYYLI
jgi:hypothetical protein